MSVIPAPSLGHVTAKHMIMIMFISIQFLQQLSHGMKQDDHQDDEL